METFGTFTAFAGERRVARGPLEETVLAVKRFVDGAAGEQVLVFEDTSGSQCDFDLSGSLDDVRAALAVHPTYGQKKRPGPGRPKLGVVSREVSLLPRHWEWLEAQGSVSAVLRRLVEDASTDKVRLAKDRTKRGIEAASRFMWTLGGNLDGFEEASRALFANDGEKLRALTEGWPKDVRAHLLALYTEATEGP